MRLSIAFLLSLAALRHVSAEDTYPLRFEPKPTVGQKVEEIQSETTSEKVKVTSGGQVVNEEASEKTSAYEFLTEITAVDGKDRTGAKWSFKKARKSKNGVETTLGFEGKTVIGKRGDDTEWSFEYADGSEIDEEELDDLVGATDTKKEKDGPTGAELFSPRSPVKAGESWSPDLNAIAKDFSSEGAEIDKENSKVTCSLKSVEKRDGVAFGIVTFDLNMRMKFTPPLELEDSIPFHVTGELDACLDETRPDGTLTMNIGMEGKTKGTVTNGGQKIPIEMEISTKGKMTKTTKTVK